LPKRQPVWSASDYVRRAQPLTGRVDWGLLKPIFRRTFMKEREIRYPLYSRHGEDFLLILDALRKGAKLIVSAAPTYRYTIRNSGWSRTKIDYGAQVDQARALIDELAVREDRALASALESRIRALIRWEVRLAIQGHWRRSEYATLLDIVRESRLARGQFARLALNRVRKTIRRRP